MNLRIRQRRTVRGIERDLMGSDPQLASLFTMFASLTPGEKIHDEETAGARAEGFARRHIAEHQLQEQGGTDRPAERTTQ